MYMTLAHSIFYYPDSSVCIVRSQAKRGKVYMAYSVVVKWLMALLIGIGKFATFLFVWSIGWLDLGVHLHPTDGPEINFFPWLSWYLPLGTALAAVFINISVENFAGWKYSWTFNLIQKSYFAGFLVYTLINLALVLSSVYIVTQFSPEAAGSGIPEIKGYLNGKLSDSFFCWWLLSCWISCQSSNMCRNRHTWYTFVQDFSRQGRVPHPCSLHAI